MERKEKPGDGNPPQHEQELDSNKLRKRYDALQGADMLERNNIMQFRRSSSSQTGQREGERCYQHRSEDRGYNGYRDLYDIHSSPGSISSSEDVNRDDADQRSNRRSKQRISKIANRRIPVRESGPSASPIRNVKRDENQHKSAVSNRWMKPEKFDGKGSFETFVSV
jgi:hypothetical protein